MTIKNYLLITVLVVATIFSSCKKDEEPEATSSAPKIEINGKSSGTIVEVPQSAANANNGQFQGVTTNINAVGQFVTLLNSVPENATTSRSTNAATTYNWSASDENGTYEVWYSVEESGSNYNITYELAMTYTNNPEMSFGRTAILSGWIAQNGANGHLVINYAAFTGGDATLNYVYDWDTNAAGDFHVTAEFNMGNTSQYANIHYEATVYADGHGVVDYSYADGTNNIVWHYDWNSNWTIVNWTYTINGSVDQNASGQWTA